MPTVATGFSLSQELNRDIHRRRENQNVRAIALIVIRRPRRARVRERHVRILEADPPPGATQRDPDRSSEEAQTGDERMPRVGHQRAIRMMVRSTTCEVVGSKYGRCTVTCGRVGLRWISAARYVPTAFDTSVLRFSFLAIG